jgi:hypothetical protein
VLYRPLQIHAQGKEKATKETGISMQLLWQKAALLLDLPLRFSDLQYMYGRQFMGADLQRNQLAVP